MIQKEKLDMRDLSSQLFWLSKNSKIRIVIGGPKNSGKSVFTTHFELELENIGKNSYHYDYDPFSPSKLLIRGIITEAEREQMKKTVTVVQAKKIANKFFSYSKDYDIVVGDLPGQITNVTKVLAEKGTHAIIVCNKDHENEIGDWETFFKKLRLPIICIIKTNLNGSEHVDPSDLMNIELSNLERERSHAEITHNIRVLAEILF